jgi:hypothetical protein
VEPTNICMLGGSQGQIGIHKPADITLTQTSGLPTGCHRTTERGGGKRVWDSLKLNGKKREGGGVNGSFPQSILWSIRISVALGNFIRPWGRVERSLNLTSAFPKCTSDLAVLVDTQRNIRGAGTNTDIHRKEYSTQNTQDPIPNPPGQCPKTLTPWPLVRERTIPTERPPLVDEI